MRDTELVTALVAANQVLRDTDPASLDRAVPSCPGWDVEQLIEHLAQVQRWATRIVLAPPGERVARRVDDAPVGPAVIDFFADGADALVDALTTIDLDREVYSFVGPRPARWWVRRQTHESIVHAWDRQLATGDALAEVDPAVASDGIDELLELLTDPRLVDPAALAPEGETIHVHATDVEGEWLLALSPAGFAFTREHAKGDLALRGPATDLLVVLNDRAPLDATAIEVFGSTTVLDRFLAVANF